MKQTTKTSPASRQAIIGQDMLEGALLRLKGLPPRVDRMPIAEAFERALGALTRLQRSGLSDPDHMRLLSDAQTEVRRTRGIVVESDRGLTATRIARTLEDLGQSLEETRADTINRVVAAQQEAALQHAQDESAFARAFQTSMGSPRLHAPVRGTLAPAVDVAPDSGAVGSGEADTLGDKSREELQADVEQAADPEPDEDAREEEELAALERELRPRSRELMVVGQGANAIPMEDAPERPGLAGELAQLRRLTRDCLEELGVLGNLRTVDDRDRWSGVARFEQRLLNDLDAVLALGEAFCRSDARLGDDNAFLHGSLDVLQEVLSHTHDSPTVDTSRAFARAFVLGCVEGDDTARAAVLSLKQSPVLTHAAQASALGLSSSPNVVPAMRRLCLEGRREMIAVALDVLMARGEVDLPTVVTLLEHPDPSVRERAARCLGFVEERAPVAELLSSMIEGEVEDSVVAAMLESLLILRPRAALLHIRERLEENIEEPGMLEDATRATLMKLLGVGGDDKDAELLQRLFVNHDPREAEALGWHGHPSHIERLMSRMNYGDFRYRRAVARALRRITGADLRPQVDAGPDVYEQPIAERDWRQWWEGASESFTKTYRYRFGAPYTVGQAIAELEIDGAPMGSRRLCALELAIVCEGALHLRVDGWASKQTVELQQLDRALSNAPHDGAHTYAAAMAGKWLPDWAPLTVAPLPNQFTSHQSTSSVRRDRP